MNTLADPPLILPPGAVAELHRDRRIPGLPGYRHVVAIKPPPPPPGFTPSDAATVLTMDAGTAWPDPWCAGQAMLMLFPGCGSVLLAFAALDDAHACLARLRREQQP